MIRKSLIVALSMWIASGAWGAFSFVQKNGTGWETTSNNITVSLTGVTAGNLVVVWVKHEDVASSITVSDGTDNLTADTKNSLHPSNSVYGQFFYDTTAKGGNVTYTVTFDSNRPWGCIIVMEYDYAGTASFDTSNRNYGTTGTPATGNITTYDGGTVSFAGVGEYSGVTFSAFQINGVAADQVQQASSGERYMWSSTFTATYTGQGTASGSASWVANIISFKDIVASYDLEGFAFGDDNNNEASHTLGTQDADFTGVLGTKTLRTLVNATGSGTITPKLYAQKNGSGGYVAVATTSVTESFAGAVEDGDLTKSGNNTASTAWAISHPAASTGDLIIFNCNWDDSTTTTGLTHSNGKNGESPVDIIGPIASASTANRSKAWYYVATGAWSAGTIISTPSASEQWTATVIRVPAGEFDSSTPIGVSASTANVSTGNPACPGYTTGASDGGGRAICYIATDVDDADGTATGWTALTSTDRGAVGDEIDVRTSTVTDSMAIPYTTGWTVPTATNWNSLGYIIRAPADVTNQIYISASANVAAGGEATTARLAAPSGKSTSDFVTGRRWDDENGSDSISITTDDYTEVEWVITTQSPATTDDYFEFRTYNGANALTTYTVTPKWTIGTAGGSASPPFTRRRVIY